MSISQEQFQKTWRHDLSSQQKKSRLDRAFLILERAANRQLALLNKIEKDDKIQKNIGYIYFFDTVKNFWSHAEFAYALGKGKNRKFCNFPARLLMETVMRLEFYIRKSKKEQDDIAIKEMLRVCKRYYDRDKTEGRNPVEFRDYYVKLAVDGNYPDIDKANPNINPFPDMKTLTENSKINDASKWYFHFQALAESTHGKLFAIKMARLDDLREYIRSMMYVLLMCNKALLIVDKHIRGASNSFILKAINESEKVIKSPVSITK